MVFLFNIKEKEWILVFLNFNKCTTLNKSPPSSSYEFLKQIL